MPWTLKHESSREYPRNPLLSVVAQLRFSPILVVEERIPKIQEQVRRRFPAYQREEAQEFAIGVVGLAAAGRPAVHETGRSLIHVFATDDGRTLLRMGTEALSLEVQNHRHRDQLLEDFALGVDALSAHVGDIRGTRLGLRYINLIDRNALASDGQSRVAWSQLIQPSFMNVPDGLIQLDESTLFMHHLNSAINGGRMSVKHGLVQNPQTKAIGYVIDIDRYEEGNMDCAEAPAKLRRFADDIYALFRKAAGAELLAWMDGDNA